ncbi:MAG: hypothetical protein DMF63_09660 [Acidobacteria bacterium]|nr:MAG: hypothetical protein DMF63_09660 [Acidobacteriota bacterium]
MRTPIPLKIFLLGLTVSLLLVPIFLAQNTSQSPEPDQSPTPSPTTTPVARTPSPTPLPGAQNFHQWGSVTVFNGLPSDSVRAIAQTTDGVMWFGTDNGLARFDGRRVQTIQLGRSASDRVLALALESTGELWVGTDSGAYVLMHGEFVPVVGTENIGITAILIESGAGFLGTDAGLVLKIPAGGSSAFQIYTPPLVGDDGAPVTISCLIKDDQRLLAATTGKGVIEIGDTSGVEFRTTPRPLFVRALVKANDRRLWFGTDAAKGASGVYVTDSESKATRISAPTADVFALDSNEKWRVGWNGKIRTLPFRRLEIKEGLYV